MQKNETYLNIPRWTLDELTAIECGVYSLICSFARAGKPCEVSGEGFAKRLHCGRRAVCNAVKALENRGYIAVARSAGRKARNGYTVNQAAAALMVRAWQNRMKAQKMPDSIPEMLRLYDWMIEKHGTTRTAVFVAVVFDLQSAARRKASGGDLAALPFASAVCYGQEALAILSGCTDREIRKIVANLVLSGDLQVSVPEIAWDKSRRSYMLKLFNEPEQNAHQTENEPEQNAHHEPEQNAHQTGNEAEKSAHNKKIPNKKIVDKSSPALCAEPESGAACEDTKLKRDQQAWLQFWAGYEG